jgi:exodeoxyribonuclease V alpha subunit
MNMQVESAKVRMIAAIKARQEVERKKQEAQELHQQKLMAHIPLAALPAAIQSTQAVDGITLNEQQLLAIQHAVRGESFCLIGAAGTGKTTCVRQMMVAVQDKFKGENDGVVPAGAIAIISFTRRAVKNISKAVASVGASKYCETIHSFLEYAPNREGYMDHQGNWKSGMRFEPKVTALNPNKDVRLIIFEESSMVGYTSLYREVVEACPNAKFIFIGDLNQLPPVFGDAVLGFKLAQLPVVELTQVYRQAMDSPIIWFQHNYTLKGKVPTETLLKELTAKSTQTHGCEFIPFKQNHNDGEVMAEGVADYMIRQLEAGLYDPLQDTILIPFNKSFGSIAINLHIAEYLAKRGNLEVFEIIASFEKKYFAVSDFVMHEKRECTIIDIKPNPKYYGIDPQLPSCDLSRYGYIRMGGHAPVINLDVVKDFELLSADQILNITNPDVGDSEKTTAASHIITLQDCDTLATINISTTGEVRTLDYGYCMTIHKSQGSEWRKVWLVLHRMHATMLSRELIYTGMTRAKQKLSVLYSGPTASGRTDSAIAKACTKAVIPGTGWKSKVEYFKGKKETSGSAGGWHD